MTNFMKFELLSFVGLKVFGYFCGILGVIGVIGFAGSLTHDSISIAQFCLFELHAFGLIGLSYVSYMGRELIRKDILKRDRIAARAQKNLAHN